MMIRLWIAVLFSLGLYLYVRYSETMNLQASHKEWVLITEVEEKQSTVPKVGGIYIHWLVSAKLKEGRHVRVSVTQSPVPTVGACLPVIVGRFARGGTLTMLDVEEWRFRSSIVSCTQ